MDPAETSQSSPANAARYPYPDPQAQSESARLDLQHQIWLKYFDGGLYPREIKLPTNARVLDIGCGNGAWATDFARAMPEATVVGIDISIPARDSSTPPNCRFEVVDVQKQPWQLSEQVFDFIHIRYLMLVVKDWPALFSQCWTMLRPGGWIESDDFWAPFRTENPTLNVANSPFLLLGAAMQHGREWTADSGTAVQGIDVRAATRHADRLRLQGFSNVKTIHVRWPVGDWGDSAKERDMGRMMLQNWAGLMRKSGVQALSMACGMEKGLAEKVNQEMLDDIKQDAQDKKYSFSVQINIGQKGE